MKLYPLDLLKCCQIFFYCIIGKIKIIQWGKEGQLLFREELFLSTVLCLNSQYMHDFNCYNTGTVQFTEISEILSFPPLALVPIWLILTCQQPHLPKLSETTTYWQNRAVFFKSLAVFAHPAMGIFLGMFVDFANLNLFHVLQFLLLDFAAFATRKKKLKIEAMSGGCSAILKI